MRPHPALQGPFFRVATVFAFAVLTMLVLASPPNQATRSEASEAGNLNESTSSVFQNYTMPWQAPQVTRTRSTLNVHLGPNRNYQILGSLPRGTIIEVIGRDETSQWVAIALSLVPGSVLTGWLPLADVEGVTDVSQLEVASVTPLQ